MKSRIYLDHAATTPVCGAARQAVMAALDTLGNPSSVHAGGRAANGIVENARDVIAEWANVRSESIIFTSGGTEALALALGGLDAKRVVVSAVEHSAVLAARPDAIVLPVDGNGLVDIGELARLVAQGVDLVAVQAANNETGVIQYAVGAAEVANLAGVLSLQDSVQSAAYWGGAGTGEDFTAVSAHKLGGPQGVGCLIARDLDRLKAVQRGGGQERGLRGGTPNLPGIAGFAAAVAAGPFDWAKVEALRNRLEDQLTAAWPALVIHGKLADRMAHISSIGLPGVSAQTQVMALDLAGFMVSAGAACSSGKVRESHVLRAMGLGAAAGEAIRVSLGPNTTEAEIDAFAEAWLAMAARLSRRAA
ncbi:MAG: cysteine desulfurase [Sandarakinorhabdus sp.]|nr:cysteine desulfurase [Sandarakinorhabdus sp.]